MVITYYGVSCFKVQSGDLVLVFDPPSKESSAKTPRFQADIVLSSHNHPRHNGIDALAAKGNGGPFVITSPGEYEVKNAFIRGVPSFHDSERGEKRGLNTIYAVELEDLILCHLGDFGEGELRSEIEETLNKVDVLFLPVGGGNVIDAVSASRVANQISPSYIVPMHFDSGKEKKNRALTDFLKEMGQDMPKALDRLSIRQKDISDEQKTEIVVIESSLAD